MAIRFNPRGRQRESPGQLQWRVRLFSLGAGLALGGIFLNNRVLIWAALALLAGGLVLRFFSVTPGDGMGRAALEGSPGPGGEGEPAASTESPEDAEGPEANASSL